MSKFIVKNNKGEEFDFDPAAAAVEAMPQLKAAKVTGYDVKTRTLKAEDAEGGLDVPVDELAASLGYKLVAGPGERPDLSLDASPVSAGLRARLGLATSESGQVKQVWNSLFGAGMQPELDAKDEKNQQRALGILKKEFQDAKIVNGEYVVKKDSTWHKVNAPGMDAGDFTEFAAQNGLNILGAIAGGIGGAAAGTLGGPVGIAAGAVAGSTAGSSLGEAAENALSYAIERDAVDVPAVAQDVATEGIMNLVFDTLTLGAGKAIKTAANTKSAAGIKAAAIHTADGFRKFADQAAGGTKDAMSAVFGRLGANMKPVTTRAWLESADTVNKGLEYGVRASKEGGEASVTHEMSSMLKSSMEGVEALNSKRFETMLNGVKAAADDRITLDLTAMRKAFAAQVELAPENGREMLRDGLKQIDELIEQNGVKASKYTLLDAHGKVLTPATPQTILKGRKAIEAMTEIKMRQDNVLRKVGALDDAVVDVTVDPGVYLKAVELEKMADNYLLNAADSLGLKGDVLEARGVYGATKDLLRPIKSKIFSKKQAYKNVAAIARDEAGDDATMRLQLLINGDAKHKVNGMTIALPPNKALKKVVDEVRIAQAGLDTRELFHMPTSSIQQAAKSTALGSGMVVAATSQPMLLPFIAPAVSPRLAGFYARNTTAGLLAAGRMGSKGLQMTVGSAAKVMDKVASSKAAKSLVTMAQSTAFLKTLPRAQKDLMLKDPEVFQQWLGQSAELDQELQMINEDLVVDAALKKNNGGR